MSEPNKMDVHYSSENMGWQTPDNVLALVRQVAPIALDPCTTEDNPTGAKVWAFLPEIDGLQLVNGEFGWWGSMARELNGLVYVNPPYGRAIEGWMKRCQIEAEKGAEIVALVPARTDTRWFHSSCALPRAQAICFWKGRLTFRGAPTCAPFPSALVYWGPRPERFAEVFSPYGFVVL